jgi:hypothetical protein
MDMMALTPLAVCVSLPSAIFRLRAMPMAVRPHTNPPWPPSVMENKMHE